MLPFTNASQGACHNPKAVRSIPMAGTALLRCARLSPFPHLVNHLRPRAERLRRCCWRSDVAIRILSAMSQRNTLLPGCATGDRPDHLPRGADSLRTAETPSHPSRVAALPDHLRLRRGCCIVARRVRHPARRADRCAGSVVTGRGARLVMGSASTPPGFRVVTPFDPTNMATVQKPYVVCRVSALRPDKAASPASV